MRDGIWSIIVHGGARTIPSEDWPRNRAGCLVAADVGGALLRDGGSALDAAELAVRLLEDDPTYNAGTGAVTNLAGDVELDAAMMDGTTLQVGAVAALRDVKNPVGVARLLLAEPTVLLVGEGARAFAIRRGCERMDMVRTPPRGDAEHDTVGCVALDRDGRIAVATSTGGLTGQQPGRVGDAPIPGSGFYADDTVGGVAISGDGESILRSVLAHRVIDRLGQQDAGAASTAALEVLERVGGEAGIVAIGRDGRFGIAHNSDHFSVGLAASWLEAPLAGIHSNELEAALSG